MLCCIVFLFCLIFRLPPEKQKNDSLSDLRRIISTVSEHRGRG